jgi:hypothetical protein
MNSIEEFIENLEKTLKDLVKTRDLVKIGIYTSPQAAFQARQSGCSPAYMKIPGQGIVYPKCGVVQFLRQIGQSLPIRSKDAKAALACDPDTSQNAQKQA